MPHNWSRCDYSPQYTIPPVETTFRSAGWPGDFDDDEPVLANRYAAAIGRSRIFHPAAMA
jgi:hypothetical protein